MASSGLQFMVAKIVFQVVRRKKVAGVFNLLFSIWLQFTGKNFQTNTWALYVCTDTTQNNQSAHVHTSWRKQGEAAVMVSILILPVK